MLSAIGDVFHFLFMVICRFFWGIFYPENTSEISGLYSEMSEYGLTYGLHGGAEYDSLRPLLWLIFFGVGISLVLFTVRFIRQFSKGV